MDFASAHPVNPRRYLYLALLCTAGIFLFDRGMELGVAAGIPYILSIWVASFARDNRYVLAVALVCSVLVFIGMFISPEGGEHWKVVLNLAMTLGAVWLTTFLCIRETNTQHMLAGRQEMFRVFVETVPTGILLSDMAGRIEYANEGLHQMFGYQPGELVGKEVEALMPARFRKSHLGQREAFFEASVAHKMGAGGELAALSKDGKEFPIETQLTPVQTQDGPRALATVVDFSRRKRLATTEKLLKELRASNKALDEFAYVASHDLRTPLDGIKTLAGWIGDDCEGILPDASKGHLKQLRRRIDRMNQLLNDLMEYSRVGRGHNEIQSVDVGAMLDSITHLLGPPPGFHVVPLGEMPVFPTHRTPLENVLRNLVDNAIKHHSGEGGVVKVSCRDDGEVYAFKVEDDGPGIPEEYQQRVFNMFETLKPCDEVEGSGIGLPLVKKIVGLYEGEVFYETSSTGGAIFRFTWPKEIGINPS